MEVKQGTLPYIFSVYLVSKNFKLYAAKMYKSSGPYAMDAFKI